MADAADTKPKPAAKKPAPRKPAARKPTAKKAASETPARKVRGLLLKEIRFKKEYRCFGRGRKLTFQPGVNLLVGDQGSGKSSVLGLMVSYADPRDGERTSKIIQIHTEECRLYSFDFERENPRTLSYFKDNAVGFQIASKFRSHGETVNMMLEGFVTRLEAESRKRGPKTVLLLDEPDMALSPRSAYQLARLLQRAADAGHQVIAAVHNPIVIASQAQVYSLEHRRWMTPDAFLAAHAQAPDGDTAAK